MPFNPALPANVSPTSSAELRGQLNGLFDLIGTIPVGPAGPAGATAAVVDSVTTDLPGTSATATVALTAGTLHFSFTLPRGDAGAQGSTGNTGADGGTGPVGPQGPAVSSYLVDSTSTLPASMPASVAVTFDGTNVHFIFGIPQGPPGMNGATGATGPSDLSGTSSNSNSVTLLGMAVSDPPTQAQVQALSSKIDELITALRR